MENPKAHPHSPGCRLLPDREKTLQEKLDTKVGHG